ncbi:glycosyltransferase family 4 protein [Persicimonas caeni]|uniref:Glycosyltransferase family 4 protein n=1 Tax=Persicimonas caeni TaxID=2292766 RepID=A0A4Y6PTV6_PERCE|nr:glycosyltransferase family 4 protein [Persicimonas caeni]QDG51680.1 glycosyltransferase family 4 protein [Persicimonas caeni]QED32901.1 glycosyltransferase family 4 protein [Persicimonas caeni]
MSHRRISLLASQAFGSPGGIQTYMRLILHALEAEARLGEVFSLWDSDSDTDLQKWLQRAGSSAHCAEGNKLHLVSQCIRHARSDQIMVVGHLGLSPIALALKALGRIRGYVVILHGIEAWCELHGRNELALRLADGIVATTPFTRDKFAQMNELVPTRIAVLPLAIEQERFQGSYNAPRTRAVNEPMRVVSVARLDSGEQYKGIDHTIEAIAQLTERGVDASYRVVGDGDDRERLERLSQNLGVTDRVDFLGRVSDEELRKEFRQADVFSLPSAGEGFGLVYLEAMYYALPSIACPEGGAQHVIINGREGLQVPYADPGALADALERLGEPSLYEELSRRALEALHTRFSFDRFRQDFISIVDRIPCAE